MMKKIASWKNYEWPVNLEDYGKVKVILDQDYEENAAPGQMDHVGRIRDIARDMHEHCESLRGLTVKSVIACVNRWLYDTYVKKDKENN